MAEFKATGADDLELSLQEIAEIPDNIVQDMLAAAGEVVVAAQKRMIMRLGLVDTGKLLNSIKPFAKRSRGKPYVLIYPSGKHGSRNRRLVTKTYKRSKHGRTYTVGGDIKEVTNAEVGFILEFGAPKKGIRAKQWMRKANEESADAMVEAEFTVYDRWLKSKNL